MNLTSKQIHGMNQKVKYPYSEKSLSKLYRVHNHLILFAFELADVIDCKLIYGRREDAEQIQLFKEGKSTLDGIIEKSEHQPKDDGLCYALDILPLPRGVNMYDDSDPENKLRWAQFDGLCHGIAHSIGIKVRTGFKWRSNMMDSLARAERDNTLPDGNHVELIGV